VRLIFLAAPRVGVQLRKLLEPVAVAPLELVVAGFLPFLTVAVASGVQALSPVQFHVVVVPVAEVLPGWRQVQVGRPVAVLLAAADIHHVLSAVVESAWQARSAVCFLVSAVQYVAACFRLLQVAVVVRVVDLSVVAGFHRVWLGRHEVA
jgi:hypothetical protein